MFVGVLSMYSVIWTQIEDAVRRGSGQTCQVGNWGPPQARQWCRLGLLRLRFAIGDARCAHFSEMRCDAGGCRDAMCRCLVPRGAPLRGLGEGPGLWSRSSSNSEGDTSPKSAVRWLSAQRFSGLIEGAESALLSPQFMHRVVLGPGLGRLRGC